MLSLYVTFLHFHLELYEYLVVILLEYLLYLLFLNYLEVILRNHYVFLCYYLERTTKDFRDNSIKTHNDFVRLLQDNLKKVNTEDIQAELRQDIRKHIR